jgi:MoaA/NifB/PqqE/SkfB family radical SAM enzyme
MDKISKYKTFCIVPFNMMYSLNNGDYRACCFSEPGVPSDGDVTKPVNAFNTPIEEVWNNKYYQQLRYDLSTGTKNKTCATCWKKEENNEFSHRQKYNSDAGITDEQIEDLSAIAISNNGHYSALPKVIQIKTGNLCNLKCIMCNQASSSLIEEEVTLWKEQKIQLPQYIEFIDQYEEKWRGSITDQDAEHLYLNYEKAIIDCDELQLVGGEPLVSPVTHYIINQLISKNIAQHKGLYFITNLTSLNKKLIEKLEQFKFTTISVSWDHVDKEKFNFIRYPANYQHFRKNFDKLSNSSSIHLKLSPTFSIFNIFDIEQIFDTFKELSYRQKDFTINPNWVEQPKHFCIRYLEPEQKHEVADYIEAYVEKNKNEKMFLENPPFFEMFKSIRNMLFKENFDFEEVTKERTRVLKLYDDTRNTDYKSLFPYIKDYQ